jgi:hypothetical protein
VADPVSLDGVVPVGDAGLALSDVAPTQFVSDDDVE